MGIEAAIIGSAVVGAGASLAGASSQRNAAKDATRAQTAASQQEIALRREIYEDQRNLQQPYYQAGLQAMYGGPGLMNLLGHTSPTGGPVAANDAGTAPQNAFSQYASGTYATQTPAQQEAGRWQAYGDANPDVRNAFHTQNMANSPHLLGGGGKGADLDGNGAISEDEYLQWHYNAMGRSEGRGFGDYGSSKVTETPMQMPSPGVVANGDGSYGQTGGNQLSAGPAPSGGSEPIGSMTATLRQTPGYQFLQDESKRQLENSFASRGKLMSGAAMHALNDRTLGLADQTYQQSVNNQFNLANLGMGSAAQITNAGSNFAAGAGNAYNNIGNAQAQGAYGRANAFAGGLQGVSDSFFGGLGAYGAYKGWGNS